MMSCKHLRRTIRHHLSIIKYRPFYRPFCASTITPQENYIPPTYDQIEEYTQTIASVLHSWPLQLREHFISTLHKAQANPRRNKNYDHLLNNKIPQDLLQSLDYYKLKHWLPYVFANDIVQIMNEIQESSMLALIHDGQQLISYNGHNPQHIQILNRIKTENYDKMIWIQDIPLNVTDVKLAQTLSKFGDISAIVMDRYQSVRQQEWIKHKQNELKQNQKDELIKTINKLRNDVNRSMINDYEQQYLCVELDIDNNYEILRLIMAHLQYQFDIHNCELIENRKLIIPVCLDDSVSEILANLRNECKFYQECGNIIISTPINNEKVIRNTLNGHRLITNLRRLGMENFKSGKLEDGSVEIEVVFVSKIETSIKAFIHSLCSDYYNINISKLSISHYIPHNIPQWYRNMNEETKHEFFSNTIQDKEYSSIAQRMKKIATYDQSDEELSKTRIATCNAFIYFKDIATLNTILCKQSKIWGMVINGARCRISNAPTQIKLKNVPYDASNPIRYVPLYKASTNRQDNIIPNIEYDLNGNVIPPMLKFNVSPEKSHISFGSEHSQFGVPYINTNNSHCNGLKAIYMETGRFEHNHLSKESMNQRLDYETFDVNDIGKNTATIAHKKHLLMKYSNTLNIGFPLIGGVIQYMLILTPRNNNTQHGLNKFYDGDSFITGYNIDRSDNICKYISNIPIAANKVKININDECIDSHLNDNISYIWKHATCTYENNELFWYLDDDVSFNAKIRQQTKIKNVLNNSQLDIFVRMGYICVYSKRCRKVNIISHGINKWNGETPKVLQDIMNDKSKSEKYIKVNKDKNYFDNMFDELSEWFDTEIDDNNSHIIAKSAHNMNVYVNGVQYKFGDETDAILLHKGWNNIFIDFKFNNMNNCSFQIVDFNEKSEIHDLYWRYSPPPVSLILQFNDHINAMQMYDKLKIVKQKRYGIRVQLSQYDEHYLENETILQSQLMDNDNDNDKDLISPVMDMSDMEISMNGDKNGRDVITHDRLMENFVNGIVENIHESNNRFDKEEMTNKVYEDTKKYTKMLSDYSPCQRLQYEDNTFEYNDTTEMFNTKLNVPSTLEFKENITDCNYIAQKFK
eukprot:444655_1